jgi:hypothetical protein
MSVKNNIDWGKAENYYNDSLNDSLNEIGKDLTNESKNLVLVKTGTLRDSIDYKVEERSVEVYSDVHYAKFVEYLYKPFLRPLLNETNRIKEILKSNFGRS